MNDSIIEEYRNLREQIESSRAANFSKLLRAFHAHYYIYSSNYEDLIRCLKETERIGLHLTAVEKPSEESNIRKTYKEVTRLIFNFLSSAKARIDFTRAFVDRNYQGTIFKSRYESYIADNFAQDELSKFVHDLRNYLIHEGIPHIGIRVNWSKSQACVYMDKDKVTESSFWTGPSKSFLSKCGSRIMLHPVFVEYGKQVYAQANWIIHNLHEYHNADIEEYKRMQSKLDSILARLNNPGNVAESL